MMKLEGYFCLLTRFSGGCHPVVIVVVMVGACGLLLLMGCRGCRRQLPSLVDGVEHD